MEMKMSYVVGAPIGAVFAYLADLSMMADDLTPTIRVEPRGQIATGDVVSMSGPGIDSPLQIEAVEVTAPRRIVYRMWTQHHPDRVGGGEYVLEPAGERTRVTGIMRSGQRGRLELGMYVMRPFLWWQARRGNRRIAAAIERRYRAGELS